MTRWMIAFRLSLVAAAVSVAAGYGLGAYHEQRATSTLPFSALLSEAQQSVAMREYLARGFAVHADRTIGWIVALAIIALYFAVRWAVAGKVR